jgi:hypothetical protein
MALVGGCVVFVLDVLYYGGPGDAGWLPHLLTSASFALVFFLLGLLPESDDDHWPGKPEKALADRPFVAAATVRTRAMACLLGLLFFAMLLRSILGMFGVAKGGTLLYHVVFSALSIWFVLACLNVFIFRIAISDTQIEIRSITGRAHIDLAAISGFERLSPWAMYPALALPPIYRVRWIDSNGEQAKRLWGLDDKTLHLGDSSLVALKQAAMPEGAPGPD